MRAGQWRITMVEVHGAVVLWKRTANSLRELCGVSTQRATAAEYGGGSLLRRVPVAEVKGFLQELSVRKIWLGHTHNWRNECDKHLIRERDRCRHKWDRLPNWGPQSAFGSVDYRGVLCACGEFHTVYTYQLRRSSVSLWLPIVIAEH